MSKKRTDYHKRVLTCLNYSRSEDETRQALQAIYFHPEEKARITCDGHKLTYSKRFFTPELSGLSLLPDFTISNREYPNVITVLPKSSVFHVSSVTIKKHHYVKQVRSQFTKAYFHLDHTTNTMTISLENAENASFCINADFLKPLADDTTYQMAYSPNNKLSPIVFYLLGETSSPVSDWSDYYLVMPIKM
jgi:hypothetical protein